MKKQYTLLTVAFLVLINLSGFGQTEPYETINKNLETPVEAKLLWPWEDELLKDANVSDFSASYKLRFSEKENSELLYFKYKPNTKEKNRLQFQLKNVLNK